MGAKRNIRILYIVIFHFAPFLVAQEDTTVFQGVTVKGHHKKIESLTVLNQQKIEQILPYDLGTLLQYMDGLTIRNYGGIGGLKTVSNRGLGGEHTQLIIDGQPIHNPQTGQVNLSTIQANLLHSVQLNYTSNELIPVSALVKGSNVQVTTFNQQFSPQLIAVKSNLTLGSFGQKGTHLAVKKGGKSNFITLFGGMRTYKGNYPYQLDWGDSILTQNRKNNHYEDYYFGAGTGFKWGKKQIHLLKVNARYHSIFQELPGAVVLYNQLAATTMQTDKGNAGINYKLFANDLKLYTFANFSNRKLHYYDPNYLNYQGFIFNQYTTNSIMGGFHLKYDWNNFSFHAGHDIGHYELESNRINGAPSRLSTTSMVKINYRWDYFMLSASGFVQSFLDINPSQHHRNNYYKIHPHISISTSDKLIENWQLFAWYKSSSRAPSFNELYYSQIGNKTLKPEESTQLTFGTRFIHKRADFHFQLQGNAFMNKVNNKIIALPTKNLFIWSIQNVGKVAIYGGNVSFQMDYSLFSDWRLSLKLGTTYQKVLDITDSNSPTYKNQIAYIPEISGNVLFSAFYKNIGLHLTGLYIGERYSLNENILTNRLDGYMVYDVTASYSILLKNKHKLGLHIGVKNIFNSSYAFIRYFVMQGRNYFIKLSYEFN